MGLTIMAEAEHPKKGTSNSVVVADITDNNLERAATENDSVLTSLEETQTKTADDNNGNDNKDCDDVTESLTTTGSGERKQRSLVSAGCSLDTYL
jgi:hypothetical protein